MKSEYVRISHPELVYGETGLLQSQLALLKIKKRYESYKSLRRAEAHGKIEFKRILLEAKEHLNSVDRLLPQTHLLEEKKHEEKIKSEIKKAAPKAKKETDGKKTIEEELAEINRKLATLSS